MSITIFTGKPGAGKTAQLVAELVRLREADQGRIIYQYGIAGLKEGIAEELTIEQLRQWWELPPGSIVAIDEAQEEHLMPKDTGVPPRWVQRLSKHRHYGFDFLVITQDPRMISAFVRRLADKHVHTERKFKSSVIARYVWSGCQDDPKSRTARKEAIQEIGTLPAKVFDLYKSSQMHTMKREIPRKVYLLVACVVLAIVSVAMIPVMLKRMRNDNLAAIAKIDPHSKDYHGAAAPNDDDGLRQTDFAKWSAPRLPGVPWSAPMFDKLQVQAQPQIFCIAVDDGRCSCITEQGTRYKVPAKTCRSIAADGLYNPFQTAQVQPQGQGSASGSRRAVNGSQTSDPATTEQTGTSETPASALRTQGISAAYVPPEYGPPVGDPFASKSSAP